MTQHYTNIQKLTKAVEMLKTPNANFVAENVKALLIEVIEDMSEKNAKVVKGKFEWQEQVNFDMKRAIKKQHSPPLNLNQ